MTAVVRKVMPKILLLNFCDQILNLVADFQFHNFVPGRHHGTEVLLLRLGMINITVYIHNYSKMKSRKS